MFRIIIIILLSTLLFSKFTFGKTVVARNVDEFNRLKKELIAGDTLLLANGSWHNVDIVIISQGSEFHPIVIMAETPGKVIFSGNSKVRLGGQYIEFNGVIFKEGFVQNGSVIEFRAPKNILANYCRVTNCVIDNYNKPDRLADDNWIKIYGRHNRFDHNYIVNKKNLGTTLVVMLNDTLNQNNYHRIDHNYFGERPRLGSNGGETIRIGTSTFSLTSSHTLVEDNYFEHCNGEVEIISVKSCDNIVRRNTFYECEGGLVLRHGDRNLVEDNFFIGNGKPNTGGVRVINAGHKIINNFFYELAGDRFRSALAILNGVPNSPINRYNQVKDVTITDNVFINCNSVELSAGKDLERTARPEDVLIADNIFKSDKKNLFKADDTLTGIDFRNNYSNTTFTTVPPNGFKTGALEIQNSKGSWEIKIPKSLSTTQTKKQLKKQRSGVGLYTTKVFTPFATPQNTGVQWYKINSKEPIPMKSLKVAPGKNTLYEMALTANPGDTLLLSPGTYKLDKTIYIKSPINILYKGDLNTKPLIQFDSEKGGFTFFSIENGGSLSLKNIELNGRSENGIAASFICTSEDPMIDHYTLFVDGCDFMNITDGRKNVLKVNKASFADTIQFTNCIFNNISGPAINIAAEKEDLGIYNAEVVIFKNCLFNKILLNAIDLYRGGNDESTTGPYFIMDHCTFNEVANIELGSVINLSGVQYSDITNSIFYNSGRAGRMVKYEDYGWTKNNISFCDAFQTGRIESYYNNIIGENIWKVDPKFKNSSIGDFRLAQNSSLVGKASDGMDLGCIWNENILNIK